MKLNEIWCSIRLPADDPISLSDISHLLHLQRLLFHPLIVRMVKTILKYSTFLICVNNFLRSPIQIFLLNRQVLPSDSHAGQITGSQNSHLLPDLRQRLFHFLTVRRLTPNPAATAAAGMLSSRRTISSRPLGVSLAFLWLFTLFLVACWCVW